MSPNPFAFTADEPYARPLGAQVCTAARDAACPPAVCAGGRLVRAGEGLCFMEGLAAWLAAGNATLPLPKGQFLSSLLQFASLPAVQATYPLHLGAPGAQGYSNTVRIP